MRVADLNTKESSVIRIDIAPYHSTISFEAYPTESELLREVPWKFRTSRAIRHRRNFLFCLFECAIWKSIQFYPVIQVFSVLYSTGKIWPVEDFFVRWKVGIFVITFSFSFFSLKIEPCGFVRISFESPSLPLHPTSITRPSHSDHREMWAKQCKNAYKKSSKIDVLLPLWVPLRVFQAIGSAIL